jgi:ATP-dependent Clp protease ATP-binding subunit ClpC
MESSIPRRRPAGAARGVTSLPWRADRWCFRDEAGLPLTGEAIRILALAEVEATLLGHQTLGTQHVLISLLDNDDGLTAAAIAHTGAWLPVVRAALAEDQARVAPSSGHGLMLGTDTKVMLATAGELATHRGDQCVVTRDLLHAVLHTSDGGAARRLIALGIDLDAACQHVRAILAGSYG